jgi:hypothetical protein
MRLFQQTELRMRVRDSENDKTKLTMASDISNDYKQVNRNWAMHQKLPNYINQGRIFRPSLRTAILKYVRRKQFANNIRISCGTYALPSSSRN